MPAIRPVPYETLVRVFTKDGFTHARTKGDHLSFEKPGLKRPLVIPAWKEVPVFIIRNLLETAGMSRERYFEHTRPAALTSDDMIASTRAWIERVVIGLNLCPFAKPVYTREQIRYVVTGALTAEALLDDLERELRRLAEEAPDVVETTLLIHPQVLTAFLGYNDFLDVADAAVDRLGLTGVLQVASFHPDYQFAGTTPDDVTNFTNRSPYPMLHLLREASVAEAVATFPGAGEISERNIETMRRLGLRRLIDEFRA